MKRDLNSVAGIVAAILFAVASAPAQSTIKGEVFGSVGTARYDAAGKQSVEFGGAAGWRPFWQNKSWLHGIGLEFEINHLIRNTNYSSRTTETGNFLYHFDFRRTEPYVLIGFGASQLPSECSHNQCGTPKPDRIAMAGGGIKVILHGHWSLRPEIRVFKGNRLDSGADIATYLYQSSVGVGYSW